MMERSLEFVWKCINVIHMAHNLMNIQVIENKIYQEYDLFYHW